MKEHRRLPNGFGQISKIKGKYLRNPYRAMYSVGFNESGHVKSKILGYYHTYNEAYLALVERNKNPYDVDSSITFEELYRKWFERHSEKVGESQRRALNNAFNQLNIKEMKFSEIRIRHLRGAIENINKANTRASAKTLCNMLFDYGLELELTDKNYSRAFTIDKITEYGKPHIAFTDEEMSILWKSLNKHKFVDLILIQCYTGFRPAELLALRSENINLEEGYIVGGMKTKAGKNRIVPIHSKIKGLVASMEFGVQYSTYRRGFHKLMSDLNMNEEHRPHDCRKWFVTRGKMVGMNDYAIKRIVGHEIDDITEAIYTERPVSWLKEEIEKI